MIKKSQRSSGLDLLRLISMFMVVLLHVLLFGGVLKEVPLKSINYFSSYFLESLSICAVNCFVLISGYFLIYQQFKLNKLVKLWVEIAFYSYLFLFLAYLFNYPISKTNLLKSIFPVLSGPHWFISCYIMLYLLFPFYNKFIFVLSKKELNLFMIISLIILSLWGLIPTITKVTTNGYNILWLSFIYILGAYIHLNEEFFDKIAWYWYLIAYLLSSLGTFLMGNFLVYSLHQPFFLALNYNSIFIVISAVSLFCLFKKLPVTNYVFGRLVLIFTPAVFGVFLIHINMFVKEKIVVIFNVISYIFSPLLTWYVLFTAVSVFICCLLFSFICNKFIVYFMDKFVYNVFDKLVLNMNNILLWFTKKYDSDNK